MMFQIIGLPQPYLIRRRLDDMANINIDVATQNLLSAAEQVRALGLDPVEVLRNAGHNTSVLYGIRDRDQRGPNNERLWLVFDRDFGDYDWDLTVQYGRMMRSERSAMKRLNGFLSTKNFSGRVVELVKLGMIGSKIVEEEVLGTYASVPAADQFAPMGVQRLS